LVFHVFYDIIILSQAEQKGRENRMATIINIEEYREKQLLKQQEPAIIARILKAVNGDWASEEERLHYYLEQSEKDGEVMDKLYPIPDYIDD